MKEDEIKRNINALIITRDIRMCKDKRGNYYIWVKKGKDGSVVAPVYSPVIAKELKRIIYNKLGIVLNQFQLQEVLDIIEIELADKAEEIEFFKRIANQPHGYAYELNEKEAVTIVNGELCIEDNCGVHFLHSANFGAQVEPDFEVEVEELEGFIAKHFKLKSKNDKKLLLFFLVTSFLGFNINHPLLVLTGEKGSSKSTSLRMLERLIDPKTTDLISVPKGADGLELRLANSYFVALDNLSSITRNTSDTLARALTKGAVSKRMLYENTEEIILDITALVALNGVSLTVQESDLLDRSLIIKLERISPEERKTEEEIWEAFEEDRPKILGCIFWIIAEVLKDEEPVETDKLLRMADFHTACIKVGRVLGMEEKEVNKILWKNQEMVSKYTLEEDVVASCLIEFMARHREYDSSVTDLYCQLLGIAEDNGIARTLMPKAPNYLSRRLNKVKSSLEEDARIFYSIKNVGHCKWITLERRKKTEES